MDQPVLPPPQPADIVLAALRAALHEATSHQQALPVTELTAGLLAHELIARGVEFPASESLRTRGGRAPRTYPPGAWAAATLPPPPSATDGPSVVRTPKAQP